MGISQSVWSRIRRLTWRLIILLGVVIVAQFGSEDKTDRYLAKASALLGVTLGLFFAYLTNDILNSIDVRTPGLMPGVDSPKPNYYTERNQARLDAYLTGSMMLLMVAVWHQLGNPIDTTAWPFLIAISPMIYLAVRNAWWWHKAGSR